MFRLLPTCFLLSLVLLVSLIKVAWEDRVMEDHKGCVNTIAGNSGGSLLMSVSDDMRNVLSATFLCGNEQHCETMGSDTGIHQEPVSQDSFLTMRVAQPLILCR
nr:WD and tetratricopeptide repeats protein 1 isoform X1 [Ipomoea batatas]